MNNEVKLSDATYEQLLSELKTRFGVIRHVWMVDDIIYVANNMDLQLTDEEISIVVNRLEQEESIDFNTITYVINEIKG